MDRIRLEKMVAGFKHVQVTSYRAWTEGLRWTVTTTLRPSAAQTVLGSGFVGWAKDAFTAFARGRFCCVVRNFGGDFQFGTLGTTGCDAVPCSGFHVHHHPNETLKGVWHLRAGKYALWEGNRLSVLQRKVMRLPDAASASPLCSRFCCG